MQTLLHRRGGIPLIGLVRTPFKKSLLRHKHPRFWYGAVLSIRLSLPMMRTRIKICGLTRAVEIAWACALGIDAIGLVFYARSPRVIAAKKARELSVDIAPFVTVTGLFMNAGRGEVEAVLRTVNLDLLQFHGDESAHFCSSFERPYIKAIAMGGSVDERQILDRMRLHPEASAFLLDGNLVGRAGGGGKVFDWQKIPAIEKPLILAGGLGVHNVLHAIEAVRPYAIDVSSGVEKQRGIKDHDLMTQLVREVRVVDHEYKH